MVAPGFRFVNQRAQGFYFGMSDVMLRVYDKVAEINEKSLKV